MARPTVSKIIYLQQLGRGSRSMRSEGFSTMRETYRKCESRQRYGSAWTRTITNI
jgi:superfamily II DNA or RNA helicase